MTIIAGVPGLRLQPTPSGRIYHMMTKLYSANMLPKAADVRAAIRLMLSHAASQGVMQVLMPRIACGRDKLHWEGPDGVGDMIFSALSHHPSVTVIVFTLPEATPSAAPHVTPMHPPHMPQPPATVTAHTHPTFPRGDSIFARIAPKTIND